ncbi:GNAT family N-acetyltransferase [Pseudomonas promysalinigenes]|uniref:GNAT family N-acetyltransferase n=1 Tax=Pseudomonas promysalinigenes TaxID=485898 RepID=A0ABY6AIH8_9PSED|nr:GNAT family N-acetyltransferase [Pseudomonas promysalinigenes]UXH38780.1 GNAT family N-acetyltransferase [Pseudomonas promysalinigenes]
MMILPTANASDDEWHEFAEARSEDLMSHLREFILERFTYKPRYIHQRVWRSGATVSALSRQFDLYFRLFGRPDENCPRETLVIARIMFKQQRAGLGRALVERLVELAPALGYKHLLIECANAKASAFAERLGFTPFDNRRHWIGSVDTIREALEYQAAAS